MQASVGREVQAILLREPRAALLLLPAQAQEADRQDCADLAEPLVAGHQIWVEGVGHGPDRRLTERMS